MIAPFRWLASTSFAHSLRVRLLVLVVLATLPAFGLLFLTAAQQRDAALTAGQDEAERLVRLAAADQNRVVDQTRQMLSILAVLPEVEGGDEEACSQLLERFLQNGEEAPGSPDLADYHALAVLNADGSQFCGADGADTMDLAGDDELLELLLNRGSYTIGQYHIDPASGEPTVAHAAPVVDDEGEVTRAVVALLDVSALNVFARQASLPPGASFTIFDSEGTLLLHHPEGEERPGASLVGTPAVREVLAGEQAAAPDQPDNQNDDDELTEIEEEGYVHAFFPITSFGAAQVGERPYISVAFPAAGFVESADAAFQDNLVRLAIAGLIAIVAAWVGADLFTSRDSETRKHLVSEYYQIYSTGAVEELEEMIAPGFIDRSAARNQAKGVDGLKQTVSLFRAAFPDGELVPKELLADRDKVIARVTLTGTHVGEFFGAPASGEYVTADGIETFRFANGMIVESWSLFGHLVPASTVPWEPLPSLDRRRGWLSRLIGRFRSKPAVTEQDVAASEEQPTEDETNARPADERSRDSNS